MSSNSSIRRQIRRKQQEIRTCRLLIERVKKMYHQLGIHTDQWTSQQMLLNREEMTDLVVVSHRFEGKQSELLQRFFLDSLQYKTQKKQQMEETIDESRCFIRNIEWKIEELEYEIQRLYDDLDDD